MLTLAATGIELKERSNGKAHIGSLAAVYQSLYFLIVTEETMFP